MTFTTGRRRVLPVWLFAIPIVSLLLYLFVLWFALRDRYQVFLYYHDMGVGFDTSPFGAVTTGRYWMTGLVASGLVSLLYLAAALMGGYLLPFTRPPRWRRLWLFCAAPLVVSIPAIVMTVNEPTLPLSNSLQVTAATLVGLALALRIGELVIRRPLRRVVWLLADGLALAMLLIAFTSLQNFLRWLSSGNTGFIGGVIAFTFVGLCVLALTTVLRTWRRVPMPAAAEVWLTGLVVTYLWLPLFHHFFWCKDNGYWTDPDYFSYISDAENFFARHWLWQLAVWAAVWLLTWGLTRWRTSLARGRS